MKWAGGVVAVGIIISFISSLGDSPTEETPVRASAAPTTAVTGTSTTAVVAVATEAASENPVRESNEIPTEFRSAPKKADFYANRQNMSKNRLYDQLTSEYGEKFTVAEADYALANL